MIVTELYLETNFRPYLCSKDSVWILSFSKCAYEPLNARKTNVEISIQNAILFVPTYTQKNL